VGSRPALEEHVGYRGLSSYGKHKIGCGFTFRARGGGKCPEEEHST
jgi:hypothetical protein